MLRCLVFGIPALSGCSCDLTLKGDAGLTRLLMEKAKRKCPNCERKVSLWNLRCAVCHHKLIGLYVMFSLLALAAITCSALLIDAC
jgi:hypothetical protein